MTDTTQASEPSGAQKMFGGFAPGLVHFTDDVLFGEVWKRRQLSPKERSLITVAALTVSGPAPMGHEYAGIVEETGPDVRTVKPGQFVVGSFFASDNTCEICRAGYQSSCVHRQPIGSIGTQAELARIPLADGTLVATPG